MNKIFEILKSIFSISIFIAIIVSSALIVVNLNPISLQTQQAEIDGPSVAGVSKDFNRLIFKLESSSDSSFFFRSQKNNNNLLLTSEIASIKKGIYKLKFLTIKNTFDIANGFNIEFQADSKITNFIDVKMIDLFDEITLNPNSKRGITLDKNSEREFTLEIRVLEDINFPFLLNIRISD